MTLFNRVVQNCATRIVLLQGTGTLLKQVADDVGVAASARVDQRCAPLRARLVNISLTSRDQGFDEFKFSFDGCAI